VEVSKDPRLRLVEVELEYEHATIRTIFETPLLEPDSLRHLAVWHLEERQGWSIKGEPSSVRVSIIDTEARLPLAS
jgi:hypothetical protein